MTRKTISLTELDKRVEELLTREDLRDSIAAMEGPEGPATAVRLFVEMSRAWAEASRYLEATPGGCDYPGEPGRGRPITGVIQGVYSNVIGAIDFRTQRKRWREAFEALLREAVQKGEVQVSEDMARRWEIKL